MTTHDVLRKARAYLLEHGWHQGDYGVDGGPRCALGACRSAIGLEHDADVVDGHFEEFPHVKALEASVGNELISVWNDEHGRTFGEVIAAFDAAIEATAPPEPDEPPFTALADLPAEQYVDALSALALIPAEALT